MKLYELYCPFCLYQAQLGKYHLGQLIPGQRPVQEVFQSENGLIDEHGQPVAGVQALALDIMNLCD